MKQILEFLGNLSRSFICLILSLAVLTQYLHVADGRTERQTLDELEC